MVAEQRPPQGRRIEAAGFRCHVDAGSAVAPNGRLRKIWHDPRRHIEGIRTDNRDIGDCFSWTRNKPHAIVLRNCAPTCQATRLMPAVSGLAEISSSISGDSSTMVSG